MPQLGVLLQAIIGPPVTTSGVLSEGEKRDSKGDMPETKPLRGRDKNPTAVTHGDGLGRGYFAPEPASRTRPRRTWPVDPSRGSRHPLPKKAV